jgi:transglutaminase-like putative cysteine protease
MPILTIRHLTRYRYRRPVGFGEHRVMFRPREGADQTVLSARLDIHPEPTALVEAQDVFGNAITRVRFAHRADDLSFVSHVRLEHTPRGGIDAADEAFPAAGAPFLYDLEDQADLAAALAPAHDDGAGEVASFARRFAPANGAGRVGETLIAMTHAIHEDFAYERRLQDHPRAPGETLDRRSGSCRDFAVLMIDAARRLGIAARFVSGYLCAAPGRVGGGHTHAWAQVFLPSHGWLDLDPTNGIIDGEGLIRVAVATAPRQAVPLHGVWYGASGDFVSLDVDVDVAPEIEPRQIESRQFEPRRASGVRMASTG